MAAPLGNKNATKAKIVADALRKHAVQEDWASLKLGIKQAWDAYAAGERWAHEYVRDTLDGKPAQSLSVGNEEGETFKIEKLVREIVRPTNPNG